MKQLILFLALLCSALSGTYAQSLKDAAESAAKQLARTAIARYEEKQIVIEVVNYYSKEKDSDAKTIETELYLAFSQAFSGFKLLIQQQFRV
ncbi:hypothetical protein WDW89_23330 [Deltaproteobacteria bacterium TL4]